MEELIKNILLSLIVFVLSEKYYWWQVVSHVSIMTSCFTKQDYMSSGLSQVSLFAAFAFMMK